MAVTKGRTSLGHQTPTLKVGDKAPDFEVPIVNQDGTFKLSNSRGKNVVLVFFPLAFTPV
ncbi:redoxin domain-containing protein [bacterium]|nr:MAG: redoxin domain-containing protein [bacterium]